MAGELLSTINPVLSQIYSAKLADQRNMDCVELNYLNIVPNDSGKNIAWTAKFDGTRNSTDFADGEDVATSEFTKTKKVPASLDFGQYRAPVEIGDVALVLSAAANGSASDMQRLFESEMKDGFVQLTKDITSDVYDGDGTGANGNPSLVGLSGGAALATGLYATISRAVDTQWAGNVLANGSVPRPLTDDLLRQADVAIFEAGGEPANIIFTTGSIHRKYAGLFGSVTRVNTNGAAASQLAMGTNELLWGGSPVVRSARCPSQTLYMMNSNNVEIVFPSSLIEFAGRAENEMVVKMGMDLKRQYMLPILVSKLANAGNARRWNVWTLVQLRVKNPNQVAIIQDVSES